MVVLILQKLIHKKWLVLCLLIGNILLIAVAASFPMYRSSAFQRMLTDEFEYYYDTTGEWPAVFSVAHSRSRERTGVSYKQLSEYLERCNETLGVEILQDIRYLSTTSRDASPVVLRDERISRQFRISTINGLMEHVTIMAGRFPQEGLIDGEYLEAIVTDSLAENMNVLLDEVYELDAAFSDGSPLRVKVVGIFRASNANESFWVVTPAQLHRDLMLGTDTFFNYFVGEDAEFSYGLIKNFYELWDYKSIEPGQVKGILSATQALVAREGNGSLIGDNVYEGIIEGYSAKAKKVEASLMILQIPVLALLFSFIYMISAQMLSMEQNEISVMKSRGARGGQILWMYFLQNLILGGISLAAGLPFGRLLCMMIGTATDFMEFAGTEVLEVQYTPDVFVYAMAALLVTLILTIIPVLRYSQVTIVNLKQSRAQKKKSLWKKLYLDVICTVVSLYGYFTFVRNQSNVMEQVLTGEALDPLLYLSSSLFMLGCGLFLLRLQPLLLQLLFKLRRKRLSPASYVSLTEAVRGGHRMEFIMLFMILTVALGIHNTTVARTIVANAENNASYINGADVVLKEVWRSDYQPGMTAESISYVEPDYGRFSVIPDVENAAKVYITSAQPERTDIYLRVMGINTGEFANVTDLPEGLLPYEYYDYLNVLASGSNVVLASENMMTKLGYHLGDVLRLPNGDSTTYCVIKGFFNYWPAYSPTRYLINSDGSMTEAENYMIVANLNYLQNEWGIKPYEVWLDIEESTDGLYEYISENNLVLSRFDDLDVVKEELRMDTLFQGTNGILTMSFIVVLLLCGVGYLIYFILSIRSRELLFGVLRAMGMRKREITGMLLLEQIFCGLYSILAGAGIGLLGARLFVPMIQNAYAASDQVLPLELITNSSDLVELFIVIGVMMVVCLIVIARLAARMNITKALKLGED